MSIFTVNRQQYDQSQTWEDPNAQPSSGVLGGGTGLPFYLNQLSQARYGFNNVRNGLGGFYIPSNKLPTWQVSSEQQFSAVYLVKASNDNDTPDGPDIEIPFSNNFFRKCYNNVFNPDTFQTIVCDDRDRDNILDCGQYYLKLGLEDYPDLFSEIFTVWDYNYIGINVSAEIFGVTPPTAQCTFTFEFEFSNQVNVTGGTIGGTPIAGNPDFVQAPSFPLDVPTQIEVVLTTQQSGTYKQMYEFFLDSNNLQAGVQITKIYR